MSTAVATATVAEKFAADLAELGVEHAFGVSGGAISFFWSALGRGSIEVTHFRHESGAAFAACEASIAIAAPVVVFVTAGPGLTNALTGMYAARHEPAHVILVSAHTDAAMAGRQPIQETGPGTLPQKGIFTAGPLFDYAAVVDSPEQLPAVLAGLADGLRRPDGFVAHISLSLSVQRRSAVGATLPDRRVEPGSNVDDLARETHARLRGGSWVIWVGGGARGSAAEVRRLVAAAGAPVMATPRGKGVVPETHPRYLGVTGFGGHPSVLSYLDTHRPEVVLVLGSGLGDFGSGYLQGYTPSRSFVQVDIDPAIPGRGYPDAVTVAVTAEVGAFCAALAACFEADPPSPAPLDGVVPFDPAELPPDGGRLHPGRVVDAVQATYVDRGIPVLAETGNTLAWAINRLRLSDPTRWRAPSGLVGSMGHFSCGVVGTALATGRPAVALVGDGAMLMNNEVSTAVHRGVPAIWVVFNDACYNMCAQGMAGLGLSHVDCSMPLTDFAGLARALGATAFTVGRADGLVPALQAALNVGGPVVVDVAIDPQWPAPTKGRTAGLLRDSAASEVTAASDAAAE